VAIDVNPLSKAARRVLSDNAPLAMKMLGARGIVPGAPPSDALTVVVALCRHDDAKVAETAQATMRELPAPLLQGALGAELQRDVVAALAEVEALDPTLLPKLLAQSALDEEILCLLSSRATEQQGEIIGTNEDLLLRFSGAIEKLYMNRKVRMSTSDRLIELAVRNKLVLDFPAFKLAAEAIMSQLIPEATEELTYDDLHYQKTEEEAAAVEIDPENEDVCERDEEGNETIVKKAVPLYAQLQTASVTEKIRRAMLGNGTERLLLVRDTNRLVSEAAAKSPRMTENEAGQIAASRAVTETVLRIIANNRELVRSYRVKLNLVCNPVTPFTFAARLLPHLRQVDLKMLAKSKNVPGQVQKAAKNQLSRRK
jgi:hypothetical protein